MGALMMSASHVSLTKMRASSLPAMFQLGEAQVLFDGFLINWLLVDVTVTHLQDGAQSQHKLARQREQSEYIQILRDIRGSLYSSQYD